MLRNEFLIRVNKYLECNIEPHHLRVMEIGRNGQKSSFLRDSEGDIMKFSCIDTLLNEIRTLYKSYCEWIMIENRVINVVRRELPEYKVLIFKGKA